MRKAILLSCNLLLILNMYGQYPIQIDSAKIRGIYKSFDEFKNNSPSVLIDFTIEEKSTGTGSFGAGEKVIQYKIKVANDKKSQIDSIWGFCDGQDVYRHDVRNVWFTVYSPIVELTSYPYYKGIQYSFSNGGNYIAEYVIDIHDGSETLLTVSMIKKLLKKNDPELYDKFRQEVDKKQMIYKYYVQYKKRNPE